MNIDSVCSFVAILKRIARQLPKISKLLDGFYEWYDIEKGNGYGSENQVWSAALYLKVEQILNK